jgi:hypothetical protein
LPKPVSFLVIEVALPPAFPGCAFGPGPPIPPAPPEEVLAPETFDEPFPTVVVFTPLPPPGPPEPPFAVSKLANEVVPPAFPSA